MLNTKPPNISIDNPFQVISNPFNLCNELWAFNLSSQSWSILNASGTAPPVLASHSATSVGGNMVVLGGRSLESQYVQGVYVYNAANNTWRRLYPGGDASALVQMKKEFVLFL